MNNAEAKAILESGGSSVRSSATSVLRLWEDSINMMQTMGVTTFIEVGPGTVLTGLVKRIAPDARLLNVHDPKSLEATIRRLGVNRASLRRDPNDA